MGSSKVTTSEVERWKKLFLAAIKSLSNEEVSTIKSGGACATPEMQCARSCWEAFTEVREEAKLHAPRDAAVVA